MDSVHISLPSKIAEQESYEGRNSQNSQNPKICAS